jgi:hypothetical protein
MAQAETERLTQILWGAALSRAVCTIAELGIADQIEAGSPQSVESLAGATGIRERSLYRILRFLASHGVFQEKGNHQFDHTPLSHCLRSNAEGSFRPAARMMHRMYLPGTGCIMLPSQARPSSIRFLDNHCSIISGRIPMLPRSLMPG